MSDEMAGRVAVVTGAASGIGRAIAQRLGQEGMHVVLADVDADGLGHTDAAVRAGGAGSLVHPCDVRSFAAVEALATAAVAAFGRVDVVVNNAGVAGHIVPTWETTDAEWDFVMGVNVTGVVNGIRAFVPRFLAQGSGHVVNTASIAGLIAVPYMAAYSASKHAVVGISQSLRAELDARGGAVKASVLCPGFVRTKIMASDRLWDESSLGRAPTASAEDGTAGVVGGFMTSGVEGGVEPSVAAQVVLDGLHSGQFLLTTDQAQALHAVARRTATVLGHAP